MVILVQNAVSSWLEKRIDNKQKGWFCNYSKARQKNNIRIENFNLKTLFLYITYSEYTTSLSSPLSAGSLFAWIALPFPSFGLLGWEVWAAALGLALAFGGLHILFFFWSPANPRYHYNIFIHLTNKPWCLEPPTRPDQSHVRNKNTLTSLCSGK